MNYEESRSWIDERIKDWQEETTLFTLRNFVVPRLKRIGVAVAGAQREEQQARRELSALFDMHTWKLDIIMVPLTWGTSPDATKNQLTCASMFYPQEVVDNPVTLIHAISDPFWYDHLLLLLRMGVQRVEQRRDKTLGGEHG